MPSKKKKYNARFPAGRIKKIMQTDEEVGKVAQAVPIIISRTLELFVSSLLTKAMQITSAKNAKTLSPSHMKQCILSEQRFDFLKDLVETVQDSANGEDETTTSVPIGYLPLTQNKSVPERRSSSSSIIKEEMMIKEPAIKKEIISEPSQMRANCSTHLTPNFYSEITTHSVFIKEEPNCKEIPITKRDTIIKKETLPELPVMRANCSTFHLTPNFYSEVTTPEQRVSIHTSPVVSGYQQSQTSYQEPTRITPSPVLVMDEDYDTEINCS